ncbi:MAG TPA: phospholipid carrier-dependent glycosyltransferase, partial [Abditibacteriaceae bacterium]
MPYLADVAIFGLVLATLILYALGVHLNPKRRLKLSLDTLSLGVGSGVAALAWVTWFCGHLSALSISAVINFFFLFLIALSRIARYQGFKKLKLDLSYILHAMHSLKGLDRLLLLYLAVVFLLTFLLTLVPPNATDWDSLMYHLAAPAQYLRAGKIIQLPYDHHTYFPFTMEMLFLWGMAIKGPVLAKLFHWLMLPLCCGALIAIGKRHFSLRAGLFAAALFASIPLVQAEASTAYIDLGLAAFTLLAYLCFLNWKTTKENSWLLWCGAFCGFCLGTKYLGVLTFGWLGLWALIVMVKGALPTCPEGTRLPEEGENASSGRGWVGAKPLATFVAVALLFGGGWYARNWVQTGNPVYPFAYSLFGGTNWNQQMADQYETDQKAYGFGRTPLDLIMLPWRASIAPFNTSVQQVNSSPSGENGVVVPRFAGLPWWPFVNLQAPQPQNGLFDAPGMVVSLPLRTMLGPAFLAFGLPLLFVRRKPW